MSHTILLDEITERSISVVPDKLGGTWIRALYGMTDESARTVSPSMDGRTMAITGLKIRLPLYLKQYAEEPWLGLIRFVVRSEPASKTFAIDIYYRVYLYSGYQAQNLQDLCDGAVAILNDLRKYANEKFTFAFYCEKKIRS